jgi:hypothetical protein
MLAVLCPRHLIMDATEFRPAGVRQYWAAASRVNPNHLSRYSIVKQPSVIALFLCGAGYAVVPLPYPSEIEGDGAPSGATIVLSCRVPSRERGRLSARHRGVLPSGGRARFAGVLRLVDDRRQPAPGGQPVLAAGRSPDAARVRGLLATPAGADPLHTSRRNRFASLMGADNYRDIIL